ncbi:glycosyltransferase involved in cell wall biosynthesis [Arthrobacter woluwensis]|uniref:glycosyltransferase n=1 Tax=Arthrobacter woluwensis TaxID=156980 RepID=UPI0027835472|nr:glycosyltransferase [Arthrobacter woluwensis]MDQ0708054.1 glycosyltransferase involved in cell wall biosynthesis [Arthrobacter woluwensis]
MSAPAGQGLPRVLISAYACGPGLGSEPGAGWAVVEAAARHARVWVMTRERFAPAIARALAADSFLASRVRPVYVDLPDRYLRAKRRHRDVYWYYPLWQRESARVARRLHQEHHFTLLHHATFAADWMPSGLAPLARDLPLVWGPVGGATYVPPELWRWLGVRGTVHELLRSAATRAMRRLSTGPTAARAAVTVALNADTARRFRSAGDVLIAPNVVLEDPEPAGAPGSAPGSTPAPAHRDAAVPEVRPGAPAPPQELNALFVGRLVAWKGVRLALAAVAENPQWSLTFVGDGPEREWLEAMARRRGMAQRVHFLGQLERSEVLRLMGLADALLFPSLHDSCGWVVGEALSRGLPVVCVDLGGPPSFLAERGQAVPVGRAVVADLCQRLDTLRVDTLRLGARRPGLDGSAAWPLPDPASWTQEAFTARVGDWYRRALAAQPAHPRKPVDHVTS